MDLAATVRALVYAAYELGWANACHDHITQRAESTYPIGEGRALGVDSILNQLDPNDLLKLQAGAR